MLQHGTIEYAYKGTVVYTGIHKGPLMFTLRTAPWLPRT